MFLKQSDSAWKHGKSGKNSDKCSAESSGSEYLNDWVILGKTRNFSPGTSSTSSPVRLAGMLMIPAMNRMVASGVYNLLWCFRNFSGFAPNVSKPDDGSLQEKLRVSHSGRRSDGVIKKCSIPAPGLKRKSDLVFP